MSSKKYTILSTLLLFFLSALVMLRQLTSTSFFSCFISDTFTYTSWAWQFTEALKEGIVYPRWIPLNFWGYGSPTFILYPPIAFYLVAFFNMFTNSVIVAMNITKFTALFISATGMFFLVKEFYSEKIALFTAAFFILFPFNVFWIYLGASFASPVSVIWFSPILLFIYKYFIHRKYKYILVAGALYGGLISTHLITAYMFTFVIIAFILYLSISKKYPAGIISIPVVALVGTSISSAYFLPMLFEKQLLNLKDFGGGSKFSEFFVLPKLTDNLPAFHFWPVFYNHYVTYIIFFCILLLLFFFQRLKLKHVDNIDNVKLINNFFLVVAIVSMFFLFGASTFIWKSVPFFENIQFPVRWLTITYFSVMVLSAINIQTLYITHGKRKKLYYSLVASLFLICLVLDFKYIDIAKVFTEHEVIPVKNVNWAVEHLPVWVNVNKVNKDNDSRDRVTISEGEGKAEIIVWKSAERVIAVNALKPLIVKVRTFNFPGWKAYVDERQTGIRTAEGEGAMLIDIPKGKHAVTLKFQDTPIRYYSKIISLCSFVILIFLLILQRKK
jgi:uncharacterized membrane protein